MNRQLDLKLREFAGMLILAMVAIVAVSVCAVFAAKELFGADVGYSIKSLAAGAALWFWLSTAVAMGAKSTNKQKIREERRRALHARQTLLRKSEEKKDV